MMCWKFCIGYSVEYIVWQAGPYSEGGQQSTLLEKCTSQPAHHTQVDNHAVVTAEKHNQHDPFSHECFPLDFVGTSDHIAVFTKIQFRRPSEETTARNLWRWEAANWDALRAALRNTDWGEVLNGEVDQQVQRLSELLHALQLRWVPHSNHTTKASDQPWFGPECRAAADAKYRAWRALNARTRQRHRAATARMTAIQEWAMDEWKANLRSKTEGWSGRQQTLVESH
ncbi:uncharacterized protein LOC135089572 isoform X2 [Scylla paramamosain]|uniref:uncharacterized protein LOC135089572 isoform X2 n=1 Tax=Scylla paramamosain TaxID=85552 RepID=UPI003083E74E